MLALAVSHPKQRGLSLVELMVGMAVGLFVVAAAAMLVATQLSDNRRLLLETQVQQDLRATLDIITRDMRRAGAQSAPLVQLGLASATGGGLPNSFAAVTPLPGSTASELNFKYRRGPDEEGPYGFKLDGGVIKSLLAAAGWQALTDANTLVVTRFSVTARPVVAQPAAPIRLPCPKLCPVVGAERDCWPTLVVREFVVVIEGRSASDASVRRTMSSNVRLRNDWLQFNDAANPNMVCPA